MITTHEELMDAKFRKRRLVQMRSMSWDHPVRGPDAGPKEAELTRRILALTQEIEMYELTQKLLA